MDVASRSMRTREPRRGGISWRVALLVVLWLATTAAAFGVGVLVHKHRMRVRAWLRSVQAAPVLQTNMYNLRVELVAIPSEGRDGGVAPLGDGVLFVNRRGAAWYVDPSRELHPLQLTVPVNVAEFEADPYNARTTFQDRFAVKDVLVQPLAGDSVRVLATHNHWYVDGSCNTLRVSMTETTVSALLAGGTAPAWSTLYETSPCRSLTKNPNGTTQNPTLGAGGRLAALSRDRILLSVGGFGPEQGPQPGEVVPEDSPYGKTVLIDVATGSARNFSSGHRNPQGLAVDAAGRIWETEHAARGGDELNRIVEGADYGYPHVSYGTEYGALTWPGNPIQGRHEGYEKPVWAWVPSIGISQVLPLSGVRFTKWGDDLLVSSLGAETLYRVRLEGDRAVFVEPIPMERRIRDIAQLRDGTIVLKADDDFLVYISPLDEEAGRDPSLTPEQRGGALASQCQGCHTLTPHGVSVIGPALWGVYDRDIASRADYTYTPALQSVDGEWDESSLRAFLMAPDSFAPGTSMILPAELDADQISDLIAYLRTLR